MAEEVISAETQSKNKPGNGGEYAGANTRDHNLEIVNQYRDTVDEYNSTANSAVKEGVKELQALEAASNNAYAQAEQAAARDYRELLDTRSGMEQNNGNRQRIGESQFGQTEASYENALDSVRAAQAQMTKDVARQVSDLRAQGEYQKANAALQAAQNYLTNQYAEALRVDANLRSNYEYQTALDREDAAIEREQSATDKAWLREMGMTLLQQGVMPDSTMLEAMGISTETAQSVINRAKLSMYSGGSGSGSGSGSPSGSPSTSPTTSPSSTQGYNYNSLGYGSVSAITNNVYDMMYNGNSSAATQYIAAALANNSIDAGYAQTLQSTVASGGSNSVGYQNYIRRK